MLGLRPQFTVFFSQRRTKPGTEICGRYSSTGPGSTKYAALHPLQMSGLLAVLIQSPICVSLYNVSIVDYCPSTSSVHPYSHLLPQPPCLRPLSSLQLTPSSTKQPLVMMVCIRAVLRIYHSPLLAQVAMESKRQQSDGCSAPPLNCKQGRHLLTPKSLSQSRDTTLPPSVVKGELQLKPNCTPFSTATLNLHPSILPHRDRMDLP